MGRSIMGSSELWKHQAWNGYEHVAARQQLRTNFQMASLQRSVTFFLKLPHPISLFIFTRLSGIANHQIVYKTREGVEPNIWVTQVPTKTQTSELMSTPIHDLGTCRNCTKQKANESNHVLLYKLQRQDKDPSHPTRGLSL